MTEQLPKHLLDAPIVPESGIKNANFFNGRVLTATDLQDEQVANRRQHQQLGRAVGAGVISGLELRLIATGAGNTTPVLEVSRGLALNRRGQAVELTPPHIRVALARKLASASRSDAVFADCQPLQQGPDLVGRGAYIFAVAPASAYRDRAPMVPVGGGGQASGCGDRYAVEGVVFRLIEIPLALMSASAERRDAIAGLMSDSERSSLSSLARAAARSTLRNLLAHACFGSEARAAFPAAPLAAPGGTQEVPPTLDERLLADGLLSDCDVPLAILFWTRGGVRFVDLWSLRRRPVVIAAARAPFLARDDTTTITEAMLAQFQAHLNDLIALPELSGLLAAIRMVDFFRYLPPCGALPVTAPGTPGGIHPPIFLAGLPARDQVFIEGATLAAIYQDGLACPPLDLQAGEFFWLYRTRENAQATVVAGEPPAALFFASGYLPYRGDARINQARWGFSNVAGLPVF